MLLLDVLKNFVELFAKVTGFLLNIQAIQTKKRRNIIIELSPYFTGQDIVIATDYFVQTRFQDPVPEDNATRVEKSDLDCNLVPYLTKSFESDRDGGKYYLVLGDIGLGKTTFLINLFFQIKEKVSYLSDALPPYDVKIFPLGNSKILAEIEKIEDKRNTVLLLDAFDEDVQAVKNYRERLVTLINKTEDFWKVVITCRTQFFPSEVEEPDRTGIWSFGEGGEYRFQKFYIDYFNDSDTKKYLRKKFPFFSSFSSLRKREKARSVIKKCPLMMWPMLLTHIEDFLNMDYDFQSYQLYEVLIDKWILRESRKKGIREKYGTEEHFKTLLHKFCQSLAVNMYNERNQRGGYFVHKDEKVINSSLQLSDLEAGEIVISEIDAKSRSLLNRSADGRYKFVHKSVLEFFLSKELSDNSDFLIDFDFNSMNLAERFYNEKFAVLLKNIGGKYSYIYPVKKYPHSSETFSPLSAQSSYEIKKMRVIIIAGTESLNPLHFVNLPNLLELIVIDEQNLFPLYLYYALMTDNEIAASPKQQKFLKIFNKSISTTVKEHLKNINVAEMRDILAIRSKVYTNETKTMLQKLDKMNYFEKISSLDVSEKLEVLSRLQLNAVVDTNQADLVRYFNPVKSVFEKAALLQKSLPRCLVRY